MGRGQRVIDDFGATQLAPGSAKEQSEAADSVSVILGRVSTEDGDRVLETIRSFSSSPCEIVIADRIGDAVSDRIRREHPQVKLIPCSPNASLPEMRTLAFEASSGQIVAVTEDHCIPCPGWVEQVRDAFRAASPEVVAVGGSVINGVTDRPLDWATFLCEYSAFIPPMSEGDTQVLPGMNVAYRRRAIEQAPRDLLTKGFWETTLHPRLLADGGKFLMVNALRMEHAKRFSLRLFLAQRFLYSRYYSGIRFRQAPLAKRLAAAIGCLMLPPLLLARATKSASSKGKGPEFRRALPHLALMMLVWSWGESVGALLGPKDSLARIE